MLPVDGAGGGSLDGSWEFFPGDGELAGLDGREPEVISVPGLWEAEGRLTLDGVAWYRRAFSLDSVEGHWTLRFGAVMDRAEVYLNGHSLGGHEGSFTPFELDPSVALVAGRNVLAVRVTDPPLEDPELYRLPHGKQGWANDVFPSPPSLYMTYGGIWQPVTLRRHGPVVIRDVFVNSDPDELTAWVELESRAGAEVAVALTVRTLGRRAARRLVLAGGDRATVELRLGRAAAERWSPERPALHEAVVEVGVDGQASDSRSVRYGLRSIRVDGDRILIDDVPYRMKSALVQGFWPESLYAEPGRAAIEAEVRAAKAIGLNTLRLHIKAFDPAYLEVCDELGMLLHCDIPVAEPIDHEDLGGDTETARNCVAAARQQVRRDRNHPSVVMWSAMNEVCYDRREARRWPGYEAFARAMVATVRELDPTRPVIENDWIEPDAACVFATPVLTAHCYGRLHTEYLERLDAVARGWRGTGRPLYVTEFGDWGLPEMPRREPPPFWYQRDDYASAISRSAWPGGLNAFLRGTQRYQGLSDRLQGEVFRRHDHVGGYCLTELTDVPHELNGALDLERRPKPTTVAELTRLNQIALPMLELTAFSVIRGRPLRATLHLANDGPALAGVAVEASLGDSTAVVEAGEIPGHRATRLGELQLEAPPLAGAHELVLRLRGPDGVVAENRYPVSVLAEPSAEHPVRRIGGGATARALDGVGAIASPSGPTVVAEGALDAAAEPELKARLRAGETVLVLAQEPAAAPHYPVPVELRRVSTQWGSSIFHYTTDHGALPSLPRRTVLAVEDATIKPLHEMVAVNQESWPSETVVAAFKPVPYSFHATVIGAQPLYAGRLIVCQYRLADRAAAGDPTAAAVLADLVNWAAGAGGEAATEAATG